MTTFAAHFVIISTKNCPYYSQGEYFSLTEKTLALPLASPTCLILARELTEILFTLLPHMASGFQEQRQRLFTCGGCTGLIKFRLSDPVEEDTAGMVISGPLEIISPAELLQMFHMHQKSGRLLLETRRGTAKVLFREGALIAARFLDLDNQQAIFQMLREKKGSFRFLPGLPPGMEHAREIGDFMMILMEGLKQLDENRNNG